MNHRVKTGADIQMVRWKSLMCIFRKSWGCVFTYYMLNNLLGGRWAATRGVGRPTNIKETIKQHCWCPQIFQLLLVTCWLYRQYPYFDLFFRLPRSKTMFFSVRRSDVVTIYPFTHTYDHLDYISCDWLTYLWWFQHPISLVVSSPSEADIPWVVRIKNDQKHCYGSISPLSQCWLNPFQHYHALSPWMISSITS